MPDVNYCVEGSEGWIELKIGYAPKRDPYRPVFGTTRYGMNREQINWHIEQRQAGGRSFILIRIERELILLTNTVVSDINNFTLHEMRRSAAWLASMPIARSSWNLFWKGIRHVEL